MKEWWLSITDLGEFSFFGGLDTILYVIIGGFVLIRFVLPFLSSIFGLFETPTTHSYKGSGSVGGLDLEKKSKFGKESCCENCKYCAGYRCTYLNIEIDHPSMHVCSKYVNDTWK